MLSKRDFIDLIKLTETVDAIEAGVKVFTGNTASLGGVSENLYIVWDIIRRNSAKKFQYNDDLFIEDQNYDAFSSILGNKELTHEEKYELLTTE